MLGLGLSLWQGALGGGGGGLAAPTVRPSDILNNQLWLTASDGPTTDGTTPAVDNDLIQQWIDKSGNARHATQATSGSRPILKTGIINGKSVARFSSKSMATASLFGPLFNTAFTSFGVDLTTNPSLNVIASNGGVNLFLGIGGDARIWNSNNLSDTQIQALTSGINSGLSPAIWICRYDGALKTVRMFADIGNKFVSEAATGNLGLSGGITLGQLSSGGFSFAGDLAEIGFYDRHLTGQDLSDLENYLIYNYLSASYWTNLPKHNIICDGDSITFGLSMPPGQDYPSQMGALLGSSYRVKNDGVSSQTLVGMTNDAVTTIDPFYNPKHPSNIVAIFGGTNDIRLDNASAATVYSRFQTYCAARRAVGWKVIVVTMLPRTEVGLPVDFETRRQAFNTDVRANWATFADALADVAADANIGDAGDELNTTYYIDGIHPTAAGYAIIAPIVGAAVQSLS